METRIATSGQRIGAAFVDGFVLLPLTFADEIVRTVTQLQWILFLVTLLSLQSAWLYTTIMHGRSGQTLGKLAMGISVVRHKSRDRIGFRRAALRDAPYIIMIVICSGVWAYANIAWFRGTYTGHDATLLETTFFVINIVNFGWCLLEIGSLLFHPERRAIHDLIAGTMVVEKSKS